MYNNGEGISQDLAAAARLFERAANSGIVEADLILGNMCEQPNASTDAEEAVAAIRCARREKAPSANLELSSITREGCTLQGISLSGRGVFTNTDGGTYAGQCKSGHACGLGVLTSRHGGTSYSEHGCDGWCGRSLTRNSVKGNTSYFLVRVEETHRLLVSADGFCMYNWDVCAPDDPRLLALIAHVAPVEALASAAAKEAEEAVKALPRRLAGLELILTVMLGCYREPTVASELAAGLLTLPSGVLSIIFDAILR
jgi:hypothetical protein